MTVIGAFESGWAATGRRSVDDSAMPDRAARARTAGLLLLLTPVIWGATFPAAQVALRDVSPWTFVAWSRGLGLLAILVVGALWRPPRPATCCSGARRRASSGRRSSRGWRLGPGGTGRRWR